MIIRAKTSQTDDFKIIKKNFRILDLKQFFDIDIRKLKEYD